MSTTQLNASGVTWGGDASSQTTAGLPIIGGTTSGYMKMTSLVVGGGSANTIRTYWHTWVPASTAAGQNRFLFQNAGSYSDLHFQLYLRAYNGTTSQFTVWGGVTGGYGAQWSTLASSGTSTWTLNLQNPHPTMGYGWSNVYLNNAAALNAVGWVHVVAYIYNSEGITAINGTVEG